MTDPQAPHSVTLEQVCQEQAQPFVWLSRGDYTMSRTLNSLVGPRVVPSFQSAEMYCGRVQNAVIFGKCYISDKIGRAVFLNQSHRNYLRQEFIDFYEKEIAVETSARPRMAPECCYLGGFSAENKYFGHFIFEFLYRLVAFEMCGVLNKFPLAVLEGIPDGWLSFIELFGVPRDRILKVPQYPAPSFDSVWVASCPNFLARDGKHYAFWDEGIHRLRQNLLGKALDAGNPGPELVFLGRKDAAHRRLSNETEVWEYLESKGFSYPEFVGKSAAEQIRLIGSSKIVVSVGGSQSTMTHFAPKGCIIIEILPPHLVGGLGSYGFASVIGQSFTRIPAKVIGEGELGLANDMVVELQNVQECVELALKLLEKI
jgi:hypothetical protein